MSSSSNTEQLSPTTTSTTTTTTEQLPPPSEDCAECEGARTAPHRCAGAVLRAPHRHPRADHRPLGGTRRGLRRARGGAAHVRRKDIQGGGRRIQDRDQMLLQVAGGLNTSRLSLFCPPFFCSSIFCSSFCHSTFFCSTFFCLSFCPTIFYPTIHSTIY